MESEVRRIKIHYRQAKLDGTSHNSLTLQNRLSRMMKGPLAKDARERIFALTDDGQHHGCLNYCVDQTNAFTSDIMHLDEKRTLPRWVQPTEPKPVAEIIPHHVDPGQKSLGEPVYLMVVRNHVAVIERFGFRGVSLARYLNGVLERGGELEKGTAWKLVPKIEVTEGLLGSGGVRKIVVKPDAALIGDAPSQAPAPKKGSRAKLALEASLEDMIVHGKKVFDLLVAAGADETKIETLKQQMSTDLVLKAKLELSVAAIRRKTTAQIAPDAIQQALADLSEDATVVIESTDGKTDGKLVQLMHEADVLESGGLLHWDRASQALTAAMNAWAAKGAIDLKA